MSNSTSPSSAKRNFSSHESGSETRLSSTSEAGFAAAAGEVLILFALVCLLAAEPVPGVNESHYLPKAKHVFNPSFGAGDLFFESHDAHGLASGLAGALALWLPLSAVAWIGRFLSWLCLAWAWRRLRIAMNLPWAVGAAGLCSWYFAIDYGNWAGEWAVGGYEGKSVAYPCIIVAFSELFRGNWPRVWVWLGLAVAWHPLAGGWAGLSFGIAWLCMPELLRRLRAEAKWLALGTLLGLVGVVPAGLGLNSPNQVGSLVASQIHVFYRLEHHQCPSHFAFERHVAGAISLGLLIAVTVAFNFTRRKLDRKSSRGEPVAWLLTVAWIAVGFSLVGIAIDFALSRPAPILASQLLRFYWFRWSDIAVPLAWTLTFWKLAAPNLQLNAAADDKAGAVSPKDSTRKTKGKRLPPEHMLAPERSLLRTAAQVVGGAIILLLIVRHSQANFERKNPAADDILLKAPAARAIETDRYIDWLAVCDWAAKNSPPDSLWFTPEYQQTFKWYAGRAEVVCWKDVPQDNESVRQWYERLVLCRQPRTPANERKEWNSKQLLKLARRYGFRWVIVDRTIQAKPLLDFEIMYPISTQNKSFAVFRIPDYLFQSESEPEPSK